MNGWHILMSGNACRCSSGVTWAGWPFFDERLPTILPVNYVLVDGFVVFRTGAGGRLEAALRGEQIAFEIDGVDAADRTGWSVLVRGHAERVSDPTELARLRAMPLVAWAPGAKPHYVRIRANAVTGGGSLPRICRPVGGVDHGLFRTLDRSSAVTVLPALSGSLRRVP